MRRRGVTLPRFCTSFTAYLRHRTGHRTRDRTSAASNPFPVPTRICRICTAARLPASLRRIPGRICPCLPHRRNTSSRRRQAWVNRTQGRNYRLPWHRICTSSRPPAWARAFSHRNRDRISRLLSRRTHTASPLHPMQTSVYAVSAAVAAVPSQRDSAHSYRPRSWPYPCP